MFGNPHTEAGGGSDTSTSAAQEARASTLAMCRAPPQDYTCIFTSGATGGPYVPHVAEENCIEGLEASLCTMQDQQAPG